ncbi:MAG TPA: HD-GYP domain-containing protein [Solirubrobacteraceae bacterium]|nr:HD-GYP domain-containing protein [Solirubrobacteraceae bacterium]
MFVEDDTLSSALNFRLSELVEGSERSDARDSGPYVTPPRHFVALLPLSVFVTLTVIAGPVAVVAALVPRHGMLWEALAVVLGVLGSLAFASVGAWLWMRWPRSREVIFAELMLWGWVRRFRAERRLARTRDLFESARESGSTVSIELLTQLSDLHQAVDPYLHGHSRRVASYAVRIAREMRLSPEEIANVETAALVHDIGKIYTPQEILHKPGPLTDWEFAIVKLHARDGAEILAGAGDPRLTAIVRHHHERLDGNGYPDAIEAAEIPLGSRIIAVADTFDAITSTRPYRPPRSHREAIDVLSNESGTQFDATVVAAFLACYTARRPVARSAFASAVSEQLVSAIKASSTSLTAGSIAQTLPALGVAGVLATSPALHHGRVDHRYEATQTVVRLASGPAPVRADNDKTVLRTGQLKTGQPLVGKRENPRMRINLPDTNSTSPNMSTSPRASTSEPAPSPGSHGPAQSPVGSGSESSNPTAPVPVPPTSPPVNVQPPQSTPPVHPAEPPVEIPPTPPVTISVPNTPVQISVPSLTVPAVNLPVHLPATDVSSVLQGVGLQVGG